MPASEKEGFRLTAQDLRNALTPKSRGIILNSPCNPTGAVYGEEHLRSISRVLLEASLWVLSDDVYEHMAYDGGVAHLFQLSRGSKEHGIVLNSLSKTYAMTGWRVGMIAGPREVIGAVARLQGQNSGNPNSIAQTTAIEALTGPQDEVGPWWRSSARGGTSSSTGALAARLQPAQRARRAFYAFPSVTPLLSAKWKGTELKDGDGVARMLLDEAQVALVGGTDFGPPRTHAHLLRDVDLANLAEAFNRIKRAVGEAAGAREIQDGV